jgi:hypothetical protein
MRGALRILARYVGGLRTFIRQPLTPDDCRQRVETRLRSRVDGFLRMVERGIFRQRRSPYRKLFEHARITFPDVQQLVQKEGVETALARLYDAGVYVTLDEFKGRRPIQRRGLEYRVRLEDFDNPLLAAGYEGRTGGSRSAGNRIIIDFDLLAQEAAYHSLFLAAFQLGSRPIAIWRPVPPGVAGMNNVLRHAKLGRSAERWFSQNPFVARWGNLQYFLFTAYTVYGSRLFGTPLPVPEHVPLAEAWRVARWLADERARGAVALLDSNPSSVVRVCNAAAERGLDIRGTFFRLDGEPYTEARARIISDAGCSAATRYSISEVGSVGMPCAAPAARDDVHVLGDKLALIQTHRAIGDGGHEVGALLYTTLLPACPKLLLNVESGDYAEVVDRRCGCPFGAIGLERHLHTIRSYEKLTSEGMTFLGSEFVTLIDEILPARFGGASGDYQFVEEETRGGIPIVSMIVSPRVGAVDDEALSRTVLDALAARPGANRMMAERWRDGGTLRVVRREPHATSAAKVLPLHILPRSGP